MGLILPKWRDIDVSFCFSCSTLKVNKGIFQTKGIAIEQIATIFFLSLITSSVQSVILPSFNSLTACSKLIDYWEDGATRLEIILDIQIPSILTYWGRVTQILRFYITTAQDGWSKSAFLTRACFPYTVHLIMQYIETVSEWSCWRMFIETWPHYELNFRHRASSI